MATTPIVHRFETVQIAPLMDALCSAVDAARAKAADDQRWLNALDTAWGWLLQQDAVSYCPTTHALRVTSASEPGKVYEANGACQCRAFAEHSACWHRAAARLVRRALEHTTPTPSPVALPTPAADELAALEGELYDAAIDAGAEFCDAQDAAKAQAVAQLPTLVAFARDWDAMALGARIARAAMARAA